MTSSGRTAGTRRASTCRTGSTARATGTFDANGGMLTFVLVRAQAKLEAPLKALRNGGGAIVISTIRRDHLLRQDQNGNAVSVTGSISVNFADWGDPRSRLERGVGGRPPGASRAALPG